MILCSCHFCSDLFCYLFSIFSITRMIVVVEVRGAGVGSLMEVVVGGRGVGSSWGRYH